MVALTRGYIKRQKEFKKWISASRIRNFINNDCLIDWLNLYGSSSGYIKDNLRKGYNKNFNFTTFIMKQGVDFENEIVRLISEKCGSDLVCSQGGLSSESLEETAGEMRKGRPIIYHGVLCNEIKKSYGIPDLLIRSDYFENIFNFKPDLVNQGCKFNKNWHYKVVDIKFSTFFVGRDYIVNSGSVPIYKAQLAIYNEALATMQNYKPNDAYLLGRRIRDNFGEYDCFEKLAKVDFNENDKIFIERAEKGIEWIRKVELEGKGWSIDPKDPNFNSNLYPNMCNTCDYPWHETKRRVALKNNEITLLWYCGVKNRTLALESGINSWKDPRINSEILGISADTQKGELIDKIIKTNKLELSFGMKKVPKEVKHHRSIKEFYLDFETVSDCNDSFLKLPKIDSVNMVFMIGCGFAEFEGESKGRCLDLESEGKWKFKNFTTDKLTIECEREIYKEWIDFMNLFPEKKIIYHWGDAETIQYNKLVERHTDVKPLKNCQFVNLYKVFVDNKITIPGCYNFKLKEVSRALFNLGMIKTIWSSSCVDGMGAMVAAWKCNETEFKLPRINVIKDVSDYNEIDCKVTFEIVKLLRKKLLSC